MCSSAPPSVQEGDSVVTWSLHFYRVATSHLAYCPKVDAQKHPRHNKIIIMKKKHKQSTGSLQIQTPPHINQKNMDLFLCESSVTDEKPKYDQGGPV